MTPICDGSGYWPLPADRMPDARARCSKCGESVALSKSRHVLAHRGPPAEQTAPGGPS